MQLSGATDAAEHIWYADINRRLRDRTIQKRLRLYPKVSLGLARNALPALRK